jgi:hypothetical protein
LPCLISPVKTGVTGSPVMKWSTKLESVIIHIISILRPVIMVPKKMLLKVDPPVLFFEMSGLRPFLIRDKHENERNNYSGIYSFLWLSPSLYKQKQKQF